MLDVRQDFLNLLDEIVALRSMLRWTIGRVPLPEPEQDEDAEQVAVVWCGHDYHDDSRPFELCISRAPYCEE